MTQREDFSSETALYESWVRLDSDLIEDVKNGRSKVELPLFELGEKTMSLSQREHMADGVTVVYGKIDGEGETSVVLSIVDSDDEANIVLYGSIRLGNGRVFRVDHQYGFGDVCWHTRQVIIWDVFTQKISRDRACFLIRMVGVLQALRGRGSIR